MKQSHINLYRYMVNMAGREAVRENRKLSQYRNPRAIMFHEARLQIARATFCAKLDGMDFSWHRHGER